jgi:hypothetical protein
MLAQAEQAALDAIAVQHPAQAAFVKANPANAEVSFSCLLVSVSSTYQRVRSTALIPVLTHCVFARATPCVLVMCMRLRVHVRCVCMRELSVFSLRRYSVRKSGKIRLLDIRVAQSVLDSRVP